MGYFRLIAAGLWRKPIRTVLTLLAVSVAFLLFGLLHGVLAGLDVAYDKLSDTRLRVTSKSSMIAPLPVAYHNRIAALDGVASVSYVSIFGAYFKEPINGVSSAAVSENFVDSFAEMNVPPEQLAAWKRNRIGALVGKNLIDKYGWALGDRIPLRSLFWRNPDGSDSWSFEVAGIINGAPEDDTFFADELYFHWAYFDEARTYRKGTVHQFVVRVGDGEQPAELAEVIDGLFANSSFETKSVNERQYAMNQLRQVGDIEFFVNAVLGAVLFALLFLAGTTMMQSVKERTPELGVLKSLGFTDGLVFWLVMIESLVVCLLGALAGLLVTHLLFPAIFESFGLAAIGLSGSVWLLGIAIACAIAVIVTAWPALRARRLAITEAIGGR